jgi:pimeloyl-ACP methyl ester carboxylesterase
MARYLDRLRQFARVICFDKRGAGLSDPVPMGALSTLERWRDDACIVLDAVGSEETVLIGDAEGGSDRGAHTLRGIPGEWRLFEVTGLS